MTDTLPPTLNVIEGSTGVMIPRVHWNGTSKEELLRRLRESALVVRNVMNVVSYTAPHGRDYYVIDDDAIVIAMKQHRARMAKLESVAAELEEIALGVMAQEKCG
jgi:hypothetical protein